jgi:hypothetical protein
MHQPPAGKAAIIRRRFRDRAKFDELGKRLVGLFGGSQFDDLTERGGFLAADGGQFAEAVGGILFEDAQRIATSNGGVLAGVAGEHHTSALLTARSNSFTMSSRPTAPASSRTITLRAESVRCMAQSVSSFGKRDRFQLVLAERIGSGSSRSAEHRPRNLHCRECGSVRRGPCFCPCRPSHESR